MIFGREAVVRTNDSACSENETSDLKRMRYSVVRPSIVIFFYIKSNEVLTEFVVYFYSVWL